MLGDLRVHPATYQKSEELWLYLLGRIGTLPVIQRIVKDGRMPHTFDIVDVVEVGPTFEFLYSLPAGRRGIAECDKAYMIEHAAAFGAKETWRIIAQRDLRRHVCMFGAPVYTCEHGFSQPYSSVRHSGMAACAYCFVFGHTY